MRRLFFAFLALLGAALLGAGWYAYDRGFTRKWRNFVAEELRRIGVESRLSKLTLDPFRGSEAPEGDRAVAHHHCNHVVVDVDLRACGGSYEARHHILTGWDPLNS